MKTLIVNLYAGPGAGKSSSAAYIFSMLKMRGISAEYVTEFAKDKTWEENQLALNCQFYVSGKQAFRLARVNGKVNVIVTDSPLVLGAFYSSDKYISDACVEESKKYPWQLNYFIERKDHKYDPNGRNQSYEESKEIDIKVKNLLAEKNIIYKSIISSREGCDNIVEEIIEELNKQVNKE